MGIELCPPIPEGWYEIGPDEVIKEHDQCSLEESMSGWSMVFSSIGSTPRVFGVKTWKGPIFHVIREGAPVPPAEKE